MSEEEILDCIQDIAHKHLDPTARLSPETLLVEDLALDSLRMITLVVELEDRLQICLSEEEGAGVHTVGDLVRLVKESHG